MRTCPHCQRVLELEDPRWDTDACPYCRGELPSGAAGGWTAVARVTNLAEAGFLSNDLDSLGIDTRILESESFSAVAGRWSAAYLIEVPEANAAAAADQIRGHLADESTEEASGYEAAMLAEEDGPVNLVFWRPVALMVIAGMASFVLGQQFAEQRVPRHDPPPRNSLPAVVDGIGRPFFTEPIPGRPRHRLSYHRRHCCWYLDVDADGDGHFETRERFRPAGTGW